MSTGFATAALDDGVFVRSADVNGFSLAELRFPPGYVQGPFQPELPYLAFVLDGALEKTFLARTVHLKTACGLTMPAGATHSARFAANGARILVLRLTHDNHPLAGCLGELREVRGGSLSWLAWRIAGELRATDAAAALAAEGLALELLAATSREIKPALRTGLTPAWLTAAEDLLRARLEECITLSELAHAVGVHPVHLARVFRARFGVSVGEYGRRLRVAAAATEIARGNTPLAVIAIRAGFSDQSHFTRVFKRYVGTTPARYRAETHRCS